MHMILQQKILLLITFMIQKSTSHGIPGQVPPQNVDYLAQTFDKMALSKPPVQQQQPGPIQNNPWNQRSTSLRKRVWGTVLSHADNVFVAGVKNFDTAGAGAAAARADNAVPQGGVGQNQPELIQNTWIQQQKPPGMLPKPPVEPPSGMPEIPPGLPLGPHGMLPKPPGEPPKPLSLADKLKLQGELAPPAAQNPPIGQGQYSQSPKLSLSDKGELAFLNTLKSSERTGVVKIQPYDDLSYQGLRDKFKCPGSGQIFTAYQVFHAGAVSRGIFGPGTLKAYKAPRGNLFEGRGDDCNNLADGTFIHFRVGGTENRPGPIRSFFRVYDSADHYMGNRRNLIEVSQGNRFGGKSAKHYLYCGIASHSYQNGNSNGYEPCKTG